MQPLSNLPNVQWKVDNLDEIENFISEFEARVAKDGDDLLLQAWGGLNTWLHPGDCLVRRGDSIGIIRVPAEVDTAGPQDSIHTDKTRHSIAN